MTDTVQSIVDPWWVSCEKLPVQRGQLIWAFIAHVDQTPLAIVRSERVDHANHNKAYLEAGPISHRDWQRKPKLPIAALGLHENEVPIVQKAKVRPCIVLSVYLAVEQAMRPQASPKWMTAPTLLVAPYYGVKRTASRSGWYEPLVERIRVCEYPQYILDQLPNETTHSVLRLDHIQPVGNHHDTFSPSEYRLSQDALDIIDEWIDWGWSGILSETSTLHMIRQELFVKLKDRERISVPSTSTA